MTKIGRRSQIRLLVSGVLDINRAKPLSLGERKVREVKNLYIGASLGQVPAKFGEHFFSALNAQLGADKNDDLKLCPYRKECGVQSRFRMTFRANRCQKDLRGGNQAFGFLSSSQIYFLRALVIGAGFPVDRRAMNSPGRRPNRCVSMRRSFPARPAARLSGFLMRGTIGKFSTRRRSRGLFTRRCGRRFLRYRRLLSRGERFDFAGAGEGGRRRFRRAATFASASITSSAGSPPRKRGCRIFCQTRGAD